MINLINLRNEAPYDLFTNYYNEALKAGQENIEAIAISSFSKKLMRLIRDMSILKLLMKINLFSSQTMNLLKARNLLHTIKFRH